MDDGDACERDEIAQEIARLEAQNAQVGKFQARGLFGDLARAAQETLDAKEVDVGMRLGPGGDEAAVARPKVDLHGMRIAKNFAPVERNADVLRDDPRIKKF